MMMTKHEKAARRLSVDRTAFWSLVVAIFHLFFYSGFTAIPPILLPTASAQEGTNFTDFRSLARIGQDSLQTAVASPTQVTNEDGILNENYDNSSHGHNEVGVWLYAKDYTRVQNWMIDELLQRNINTIYFSEVGDGNGWDDPDKASQYTSFINYARSKGMKVFAVTLEDPGYVLMSEDRLRQDFGNFIAKTKNSFDTYIIDVEPHAINLFYGDDYPEWSTNKKYYLDNYVRMSKILRSIANEHGVRYIDTIPPSYHEEMKSVGITSGVNALSSHAIHLMAYQNTVEKTMSSINQILADSKIRLVININIAQESEEPYLEGQQIPQAINTLKGQSLPIGIWYADHYLLNLDPALNLDATLFSLSPS
jgi:hypothetical protein